MKKHQEGRIKEPPQSSMSLQEFQSVGKSEEMKMPSLKSAKPSSPEVIRSVSINKLKIDIKAANNLNNPHMVDGDAKMHSNSCDSL
jgi:hypothetical protein